MQDTITPRFIPDSDRPHKMNAFHHLWEVKWIVFIIVLAVIIIMLVIFAVYIKFIDTEVGDTQKQTTHQPIKNDTPEKKDLEKLYELSKNQPEHEVVNMMDEKPPTETK